MFLLRCFISLSDSCPALMSDNTTLPFGAVSPHCAGPTQDDEVMNVPDDGEDGVCALGGGPDKGLGLRRILPPETEGGSEQAGGTSNAPLSTADRSRERGRGRERFERGAESRGVRQPPSPTTQELTDAAIAAEALMAATSPLPLNPPSVDSVRNLKQAESPEKKQQLEKQKLATKMPKNPGHAAAPSAPAFGAPASSVVPHETPKHPPLFHGSHPPGIGAQASITAANSGPQHFRLDAEPSWLQGLQQELHTIVQTQKQMAQQMQDSGRDLSRIQEGIRSLSVGQETLTKRADEQEAALAQMRREFKELERDLQELKSAPPTRNVSPAVTPRNGPARSNSPRFDSDGQREVDELQLVIGGWVEAKREHVEADVRAMFEQLNALPLLKAVFVPYVRSSFCRVELFYTDDNIWAQRKLQTMVLQHLKAMTFASKTPGQERSKFWFSRNRTPRERAKIRAILQVQSLCQKYLGDQAVDRDWRGKVWAHGTQVLFHVDKDRRPEQTLMLVDARGNKTGWFLDVSMLEARLGAPQAEILEFFGGRNRKQGGERWMKWFLEGQTRGLRIQCRAHGMLLLAASL